jgi:hypothetical protein
MLSESCKCLRILKLTNNTNQFEHFTEDFLSKLYIQNRAVGERFRSGTSGLRGGERWRRQDKLDERR